ncbi:M20/M25/M40 family metallo-hydrolase [Pseudonocardia eucalypti]|uniref:M20/M25/M40 family metallo-hydrolase n=1 Tax=Pseudonocardia eucalypti TaxID=648755 RepID=A0ABP9QRS9_9PSEU|nr:acetylornithine deacetylase/succinyl-diaminopimelate desuccinylase-like protein [Pseudonocardia eucalypti]
MSTSTVRLGLVVLLASGALLTAGCGGGGPAAGAPPGAAPNAGSGSGSGASPGASPGAGGEAPYQVSAPVTSALTTIKEAPSVAAALAAIQRDEPRTVADQIAINQIPAPPFKEDQRAADYLRRLTEAGLENVHRDKEGNVYGLRRGTGGGPTMAVFAHLDTVFPEGTDVTVSQRDGRYYGPGISDDARGLTAVLAMARAMRDANIQTKGDIIFGGTVGEEGLGNLRGVKAFFAENAGVDGFITIEPGAPDEVTYQATGSRRYEIAFTGPGGHSFGDFGRPSAIHAMGRAITKISELRPPASPKTTFTVGTVDGGTSVNAIAGTAKMAVDMRSNDPAELKKLEDQLLPLAAAGADEENARWGAAPGKGVTVANKLIGDRPAGNQDRNVPLVQAGYAAPGLLGLTGKLGDPSSTDANVPINLGIPAVRLGGGGGEGNTHSFTDKEWFDPKDAHLGPQNALLVTLAMVGLSGDRPTDPLLPSR